MTGSSYLTCIWVNQSIVIRIMVSVQQLLCSAQASSAGTCRRCAARGAAMFDTFSQPPCTSQSVAHTVAFASFEVAPSELGRTVALSVLVNCLVCPAFSRCAPRLL